MVTVTLKCGDSQHQIDVDPADGVEVRTSLLQCVLFSGTASAKVDGQPVAL